MCIRDSRSSGSHSGAVLPGYYYPTRCDLPRSRIQERGSQAPVCYRSDTDILVTAGTCELCGAAGASVCLEEVADYVPGVTFDIR